jgi:hypothetical protein
MVRQTPTVESKDDHMIKIGLMLIILMVIAGILWQLRSSSRRRPRTPIPPPPQIIRCGPAGQLETLRQNRNYWGVEIQSGICESSKALAGRRFPFPEAPSLPLADCAASFCTCSYVGQWEHRKWHRRAQPDRRKMIRYTQDHPDRRSHTARPNVAVWINRSW